MGAASSPLSASALSQRFTDVKSLVPETLLAPRLSSKSFFLCPLKTVTGQGFLLPLPLLIFLFAGEELRLILLIFGYGRIEVSILQCYRSESSQSHVPFLPSCPLLEL